MAPPKATAAPPAEQAPASSQGASSSAEEPPVIQGPADSVGEGSSSEMPSADKVPAGTEDAPQQQGSDVQEPEVPSTIEVTHVPSPFDGALLLDANPSSAPATEFSDQDSHLMDRTKELSITQPGSPTEAALSELADSAVLQSLDTPGSPDVTTRPLSEVSTLLIFHNFSDTGQRRKRKGDAQVSNQEADQAVEEVIEPPAEPAKPLKRLKKSAEPAGEPRRSTRNIKKHR